MKRLDVLAVGLASGIFAASAGFRRIRRDFSVFWSILRPRKYTLLIINHLLNYTGGESGGFPADFSSKTGGFTGPDGAAAARNM